jgi:hypothetical protein
VGEGEKKIDNTMAIASALSAHNAVATGGEGCGCNLRGGPLAASAAAAALMLALTLLRRTRR